MVRIEPRLRDLLLLLLLLPWLRFTGKKADDGIVKKIYKVVELQFQFFISLKQPTSLRLSSQSKRNLEEGTPPLEHLLLPVPSLLRSF